MDAEFLPDSLGQELLETQDYLFPWGAWEERPSSPPDGVNGAFVSDPRANSSQMRCFLSNLFSGKIGSTAMHQCDVGFLDVAHSCTMDMDDGQVLARNALAETMQPYG